MKCVHVFDTTYECEIVITLQWQSVFDQSINQSMDQFEKWKFLGELRIMYLIIYIYKKKKREKRKKKRKESFHREIPLSNVHLQVDLRKNIPQYILYLIFPNI